MLGVPHISLPVAFPAKKNGMSAATKYFNPLINKLIRRKFISVIAWNRLRAMEIAKTRAKGDIAKSIVTTVNFSH